MYFYSDLCKVPSWEQNILRGEKEKQNKSTEVTLNLAWRGFFTINLLTFLTSVSQQSSGGKFPPRVWPVTPERTAVSQTINVHPPKAQPGFSFALGGQEGWKEGNSRLQGSLKTLLTQQGFVPSAWQGLGDSGVTLGLAGNVGLWREMKPGCLRSFGMEMWGLESSGLCSSKASPVVPAGRIPSWKITACASASLLWGFFSLCSAVCCGTKSTARWCPHFSHITGFFLVVFLYKILPLFTSPSFFWSCFCTKFSQLHWGCCEILGHNVRIIRFCSF